MKMKGSHDLEQVSFGATSDDLEYPSRSFTYFKPFKCDHQYSEMLAVDHYCRTRDENSADCH